MKMLSTAKILLTFLPFVALPHRSTFGTESGCMKTGTVFPKFFFVLQFFTTRRRIFKLIVIEGRR